VKRRVIISAVLCSLVFLSASLRPASAAVVGFQGTATITCSSMSFSGFVQPGDNYAQIYVYNNDTGTYMYDDYYYSSAPSVYFPAGAGGAVSGSVSFPVVPEGTSINIEVWGAATNAYHDYDNTNVYLDLTVNCSSGPVPPFTDGRLNKFAADSFQSVAVYCEKDAIVTYALYNSVGYFAFKITSAELAKFPAHPAKNTLIRQNLGVKLFKLPSGQYMVARNTPDGKVYTFTFDGCGKPS
jgi:hypothetical protein